jgi:hypothetical protein
MAAQAIELAQAPRQGAAQQERLAALHLSTPI